MLTASDFINPACHFRVIELKPQIIGYYAIYLKSRDSYDLDALFVESTFIGKIIGKQLLEHAKVLVRKLAGQQVTLQAEPNAEAFYLKAGAKVVSKKESQSNKVRYFSLLKMNLGTNDA